MENKIRIASGVKKIEVNDEGEFISLPVADDNFVVRFYRLMDGIGERAQGDRERNSGRYYWKDRGGGKGRRGGEGNKAGSGRAFWGWHLSKGIWRYPSKHGLVCGVFWITASVL